MIHLNPIDSDTGALSDGTRGDLMRQITAFVMVLCLMLPGCTAPVEDEIDLFYGQDLPLDDPEYDPVSYTHLRAHET